MMPGENLRFSRQMNSRLISQTRWKRVGLSLNPFQRVYYCSRRIHPMVTPAELLLLSYQLNSGQLKHAARLMDELGRLTSGWKHKRARRFERFFEPRLRDRWHLWCFAVPSGALRCLFTSAGIDGSQKRRYHLGY